MKVPSCAATFLLVSFCIGVRSIGCGGLTGNSEGTSESGRRPIYDGTSGLRLIAQDWAPRPGPGVVLFFDLTGLVAVDGNCRFWIQDFGTADRFASIRTGILDREMEKRVAADFLYIRLGELAKVWPDTIGNVDFGRLGISNGKDVLVCNGTCGFDENPPEVKRLHGNHRKLLEDLFKIGKPVGGNLRMTVLDIREDTRPNDKWVEWPLKWDPERIAVRNDGRQHVGSSTLITDPEEIEILRTPGSKQRWMVDGTQIQAFEVRRKESGPGFTEFVVYIRDTVPFENERGLVDMIWRK